MTGVRTTGIVSGGTGGVGGRPAAAAERAVHRHQRRRSGQGGLQSCGGLALAVERPSDRSRARLPDAGPLGVFASNGPQVTRIEEKPTRNYTISFGVYALSPAILDHVPTDTFCDMLALMRI